MINKKQPPHYAWAIAAVGFIIFAVDFCIVMNCIGLYVKPVTDDLGLLRQEFSLNNTVCCIATMFVALFSGKIYKRFKLKTVLLFGAILSPIAYSAYSLASTTYAFYFLSAILGVGIACCGMIPVSMLMTNWFNEKRGLAIGIAFTGSGAGGIILNPLLASLIENIGWRNTYFFTGIFMFVLIVPLIIFVVKSTPAEKGLEPYGGKDKFSHTALENGMTSKEALSSLRFWIYIPFPFLISLISCSVIQQTVPFAAEVGFSATKAASFGALNLASLALGKILLGQIYDKKGVKLTTFAALFSLLLSLYLYSMGLNPLWLFIGVASSGLGVALSSVAYPILTQGLFGKKDYPTIYGYCSVASSLGTAIGPVVVSAIYDAIGSYRQAWLALCVLCVVSIALYMVITAISSKKQYV